MPALDQDRAATNREFDNTVGTNIRTLRINKDVPQQTLAERAEMDVTQLSRAENGSRSLKLREGIAIARALGVPIRRLLEPQS